MKFTCCPDCGQPLTEKPIGDEGPVPYCTRCGRPWFAMFPACIIALCVNECGEAALLNQGYISTQYRNLVSGYIQPGESAEQTAVREIYEETGLTAAALRFAGTYWFAKKEMLMIGFFAEVTKQPFVLSGEVDGAEWSQLSEALTRVHPAGSVSHALIERYLREMRD